MTPEALRLAVLEAGVKMVADINSSLGRRLDETNDHLRTLNGRVGRVETGAAESVVKIRNLERHVFNRRSSDHKDENESERTPFTRRDGEMLIVGVVGTIAVLTFFMKVLPFAIKALS